MDHLAPSSGVNWYSYNAYGELIGGSQLPPAELGGLDVGRQLASQVHFTTTPQVAINSSIPYGQDHQNHDLLQDMQVFTQEEIILPAESKSTHNKVRSALGEKIMCPECGATFACGANLRNHLRIHTGERPYICEECGASFTQRSNLRSHKRVHTGERPYMCGICGQTFARSSHLPGHMRTHTGEKPFDCPQCGRSFATNQIMKNHLRTHTGERPFACEVCDATFAQSSVLATHKKIHTGERNYKCSLCGKAFISRSGLQTHERVHTGEKPYTCEKCDKSFKTSSYLSKHKQKYCGNNGYKNRVDHQDKKKPDRKASNVRKKSFECVKGMPKPPKRHGSTKLRRSHRKRVTEIEEEMLDDRVLIINDRIAPLSSAHLGVVKVKFEEIEVHDVDIRCPKVEMDAGAIQHSRSQENEDPLEKYSLGANASGSVHQHFERVDRVPYQLSEHCSQIDLDEHVLDLGEDVSDVLQEELFDPSHCDSEEQLQSESHEILGMGAAPMAEENDEEHLYMSRTGELAWYSKNYL